MGKFDDLFNSLFGDGKNRRKDSDDSNNESNDSDARLNAFLDSLTNRFKELDDEQSENIEDKLGEPDRIEHYQQGHLYFERRIWLVERGQLVKILVSDEPFENEFPNHNTLSLEEQLNIAVETENYEEASVLRDLIKEAKNS